MTERRSAFARAAMFVFWPRLSFGGMTTALIFFLASVRPSLLPREWLFQGLISGLSVAFGYGLGTAAAAVVKRVGKVEVDPVTERRAWWALGMIGVLSIATALWWGGSVNDHTRAVMGVDESEPREPVSIVSVAAVVAGFLVVVGRSLRGLVRVIASFLERWIRPAISTAVAATAVVLLAAGFIDGVLLDAAFEGVNSTYSLTDRSTTDGITASDSRLRSGSDESLVAWNTLGHEGRDFTGDAGDGETEAGPDAADIETFTGQSALGPIRAYVGLRSAGSVDEGVDLAMEELERTSAFERRVVAASWWSG